MQRKGSEARLGYLKKTHIGKSPSKAINELINAEDRFIEDLRELIEVYERNKQVLLVYFNKFMDKKIPQEIKARKKTKNAPQNTDFDPALDPSKDYEFLAKKKKDNEVCISADDYDHLIRCMHQIANASQGFKDLIEKWVNDNSYNSQEILTCLDIKMRQASHYTKYYWMYLCNLSASISIIPDDELSSEDKAILINSSIKPVQNITKYESLLEQAQKEIEKIPEKDKKGNEGEMLGHLAKLREIISRTMGVINKLNEQYDPLNGNDTESQNKVARKVREKGVFFSGYKKREMKKKEKDTQHEDQDCNPLLTPLKSQYDTPLSERRPVKELFDENLEPSVPVTKNYNTPIILIVLLLVCAAVVFPPLILGIAIAFTFAAMANGIAKFFPKDGGSKSAKQPEEDHSRSATQQMPLSNNKMKFPPLAANTVKDEETPKTPPSTQRREDTSRRKEGYGHGYDLFTKNHRGDPLHISSSAGGANQSPSARGLKG